MQGPAGGRHFWIWWKIKGFGRKNTDLAEEEKSAELFYFHQWNPVVVIKFVSGLYLYGV